jgi:HPt (histidine-containing phosphotransfer) domain-containing protein
MMGSPNESPEPVLDPEILDSLRAIDAEGSPGFLHDLVEAFLADTVDRLAQIRQALDSGDGDVCEKAAHALKGSCGNVGALRLSRRMEELVVLARSGDLAPAQAVTAEAEREFAVVERMLKAELD